MPAGPLPTFGTPAFADDLQRWIVDYLTPAAMGGDGAQAHQFTINGFTYPFVRHHNFAAVPDPPKARRYDMLTGLHLARPGDLLFFFQSDPVAPLGGVDARRGIRGIYQVVGRPYRASQSVQEAHSPHRYEILHVCPGCGTFNATFAAKCPSCRVDYPPVTVAFGDPARKRVLSAQVRIKPLIAFERTVSDERVYGDMAKQGMIWIGRHDNAMGRGKGSSIRHLLPEEAALLGHMLATEPGQHIGQPNPRVPPAGTPLGHANGFPIDALPTTTTGQVLREDELYFVITDQLRTPNSNLRRALAPHLPAGLTWGHLEYASATMPWGYTAGAADYVLAFRDAAGRRFIVVIECKADTARDEAVLQVMLYIERVVQTLFLTAGAHAIPGTVEVLPLVIAKGLKRTNGQPGRQLALPQPYAFTRGYFGGNRVTANVRTPVFLRYDTPRPQQAQPPGFPHRMSADFSFAPLPAARTGVIAWSPQPGSVGTGAEMRDITTTTWHQARQAAGI